MSAQHTPGPWRKEYDYGAYNIEADAPGEPGKTFLVAAGVSLRDVPILLAAPDLLEALLTARDHIDMDALEVSHCKDAQRIREAIAKATGQKGGA